jgi:serine protease DegQ
LVAGVLKGGPADKAGLLAGDILLAIDGKPIYDTGSMLNLIAALTPNQQASLNIARAEKNLNLMVKVGKRPKPLAKK